MTQPRRLTDMVRSMIPFMRSNMTVAERDLAIHLRGNEPLFNALNIVLRARLEGRANLPVPSDPIKSHTRLVADTELRWIISRISHIYHSPVLEPVDGRGEQPVE